MERSGSTRFTGIEFEDCNGFDQGETSLWGDDRTGEENQEEVLFSLLSPSLFFPILPPNVFATHDLSEGLWESLRCSSVPTTFVRFPPPSLNPQVDLLFSSSVSGLLYSFLDFK